MNHETPDRNQDSLTILLRETARDVRGVEIAELLVVGLARLTPGERAALVFLLTGDDGGVSGLSRETLRSARAAFRRYLSGDGGIALRTRPGKFRAVRKDAGSTIRDGGGKTE